MFHLMLVDWVYVSKWYKAYNIALMLATLLSTILLFPLPDLSLQYCAESLL